MKKVEMDSKEEGFGSGYPITGLEKFLGYFDSGKKVAYFPSISITTDFSMTQCAVWKSSKDRVMLDGVENQSYLKRATNALDYFRKAYGISDKLTFYVERKKRYENAKGLGESAAVAAAVSSALCNMYFYDPSRALISRWARYASGSGTRSAAGGVSLWLSYPGIPESRNHAITIREDLDDFKIACFPTENTIKTEDAHGTASSSPFYDSWARMKYHQLKKHAENKFSVLPLLERAQEDMLQMHSLLLSRGTMVLDKRFIELLAFSSRNKGEFYVTADTGPTPVVFFRDIGLLEEAEKIVGSKSTSGKIQNNPPTITQDFRKSTNSFKVEDLPK
jgi:diphosphomevalonate decarboxylase